MKKLFYTPTYRYYRQYADHVLNNNGLYKDKKSVHNKLKEADIIKEGEWSFWVKELDGKEREIQKNEVIFFVVDSDNLTNTMKDNLIL